MIKNHTTIYSNAACTLSTRLLTNKLQSSFFFSELSVQSGSEDFSSDGVIVALEWTLLNSRNYYQYLLRNISVSANPQLNNVVFTGDMRAQVVLSYNTLYNVSVTQHSTCHQLIGTTFIELSYSKL